MKRVLFALSIGSFALGIAEFVIMGILVNISESLGVSITKVGELISAYATGVCVGAVAVLGLRRMRLDRLMKILAAVIFFGNLLSALAPGFYTLLCARFVSGLPHGAYFGVGAIVARQFARPGREVQAVSMLIAGMTVANLGGVPLVTWLTTLLSWRLAFVVSALLGLTTWWMMGCWLPAVDALPDTGFKGQFRFLRTLPPWLIFGGIFIGQTGVYCWYSYIDPLLTKVTGFRTTDLSWLMFVSGLGMVVGNLLAGRLSVRFKPALVAGVMQSTALVSLWLIYLWGMSPLAMVPLMFMCALAMFGSGGPLQSSIVVYSRGGEMLGAALIQIAYNAGNAIAAWIGGCVIRTTGSYSVPALAGIPLVAIGTVMIFILYIMRERS